VSRRWLRQLQPEAPGLLPDLVSGSPDPAEAAEIADTAARVRGAIATLADGQQHAVRLFYLQSVESVFYACVIVQGPDGPREVDARPSDAVNLAVVTGAPIRLNSELFSVGIAPDDSEQPSSFPVATADIATETQQRMREAAQRHGR
jgi:hypothetical protein